MSGILIWILGLTQWSGTTRCWSQCIVFPRATRSKVHRQPSSAALPHNFCSRLWETLGDLGDLGGGPAKKTKNTKNTTWNCKNHLFCNEKCMLETKNFEKPKEKQKKTKGKRATGRKRPLCIYYKTLRAYLYGSKMARQNLKLSTVLGNLWRHWNA